MGRKKKQKPNLQVIPIKEQQDLQVSYMTELETNPKYSLNVDPENQYSLSDAQKNFIKYYIDFRNVNTAAELTGIDMDTAKVYFTSYATQNEIRRINMALYQRQFASKLLNVDQLGGYLSSLLVDAYTPMADRLSTNEKLRVVDMLLKLNELKNESLQSPDVIIEKDVNEQLKDLSVDAIKKLLSEMSTDNTQKVELIEQLDDSNSLTMEEKSYLQTLSTVELLKLLNDTSSNKGGNKHE